VQYKKSVKILLLIQEYIIKCKILPKVQCKSILIYHDVTKCYRSFITKRRSKDPFHFFFHPLYITICLIHLAPSDHRTVWYAIGGEPATVWTIASPIILSCPPSPSTTLSLFLSLSLSLSLSLYFSLWLLCPRPCQASQPPAYSPQPIAPKAPLPT